MSEGKISSDHIKELKKFMAFFESKRSESFKEIDLDFKDFLYDNLTETIFNKEDVETILRNWNDSMKKTLSNDLQNMNRMSAIYLQYLFSQTGIEFSLNLNLLEDMKMIDSMKKVESGDGSNLLGEGMKSSMKVQGAKLPSLMESQKTDQNLLKISELEAELDSLRKINQKLKEDVVKGVHKVEDFTSSENEEELKKEIRALNNKMNELKVENKELQEDSLKKLSESAQFNNLKKMIQQKNEQLREVKERLSKYEKVE